jgi:hypothetical protein
MYVLSILSPVVAFLIIAFGTYLFFRAFGVRPQNLLFSREQAATFQIQLTQNLGTILIVANIFGTLTSLATVYVFFIGTSKLFGWFIFAAPISIAISFVFTNWLTKKVLEANPGYKDILERSETTSGVVARIVWNRDRSSRLTSALIKYLSLLNIGSIIWLEFSIAADLFGRQIGGPHNDILFGTIAIFVIAFSVLLLITRFGLRGYIISDLIQTPFIIIGTLAVLTGLLWHISTSTNAVGTDVFTPVVSNLQGMLFVLNVLIANFSLILVTETHWVRIWVFKQRVPAAQAKSTISTALIWTVLAVAGCLAGMITHESGTAGVLPVINVLDDIHPGLGLLFWLGGAAALFAVSDAQMYAFLMVRGFRIKDGTLVDQQRPQRPLVAAIVVGLSFSVVYIIVRNQSIPFEKLVFMLVPIILNALPAFLAVATRRRVYASWTIASISLYIGTSLVGFSQPDLQLAWSLSAVLVPAVLSCLMLVVQRPTSGIRSQVGDQ